MVLITWRSMVRFHSPLPIEVQPVKRLAFLLLQIPLRTSILQDRVFLRVLCVGSGKPRKPLWFSVFLWDGMTCPSERFFAQAVDGVRDLIWGEKYVFCFSRRRRRETNTNQIHNFTPSETASSAGHPRNSFDQRELRHRKKQSYRLGHLPRQVNRRIRFDMSCDSSVPPSGSIWIIPAGLLFIESTDGLIVTTVR